MDAQPIYRRRRLVVLPVSSRHTRWATSQVGAAACHATRAAATSGRSCSDGRTVFFNGQAEGPHGAPDRRHTRGRGEGVLQLSQRAIRVRRNQRGQGVEVRLTHASMFLTADETANLLRTTRKAIYAMTERGQLPGVTRIGRRVLYRREALLT